MESKNIYKEHLIEHLENLRHLIYRITGDRGSVEDTLQECCIQILQQEHRWNGEIKTLTPWMNVITKNKAITIMRKAALRKTYPLIEEECQGKIVDAEPVDISILRKIFLGMVDILSTRKKEIMLLRIGGMKVGEISRHLKIASQTVSEHIHDAVLTLQKHVKQLNFRF